MIPGLGVEIRNGTLCSAHRAAAIDTTMRRDHDRLSQGLNMAKREGVSVLERKTMEVNLVKGTFEEHFEHS